MALLRGIERIGTTLLGGFREVGETLILLFQAIVWFFRPPSRFRLYLEQPEFVGAGSFFIVFLTGTFTGLVLAMQLMDGFARFRAESLTGSTIAIALTRELGPVLTGLIVTGRVASAMATELGTMRVTEQIDALHTMAVNPIQYLVVPRMFACVIMLPVLTMFFNVLGVAGSYVVTVQTMGVDAGAFMARIHRLLQSSDVTVGVIKSVIFGMTISLVACKKGFDASGGARGVGRATTQAVVTNFIAIFALDYIITALSFGR